jgi:hypothetical protein
LRVCHRRDEGRIGEVLEIVASVAGPVYKTDKLNALLKEKFGKARLSQALTSVIIPAFDTKIEVPVFFSSREVLISLLLTLSR